MQTMVITLGSRDYLLCLGRILFYYECEPVFRAITKIFDKIYDGNLRTDFAKNLVLLIANVN